MRFQATHKLVNCLLVLAAFGALASTGAVTGSTAVLFLMLVGVSWRIDAGGAKAAFFDRRLTLTRVIVGVLLIVQTWRVARQLPEPDLGPVLDFLLVVVGIKLCYRRNNRDDFHVLVLSFLMVIGAAALGGGFVFALAFVAYVVVATWAIVLFHLRREMEDNYLVKHSAQAASQKVGVARILNSRRVVGAPFFVAMGGVALVVAAGAVATFALVPRVGAGFVFGGARSSANVVGFSDDVSLGHHGTLSTDNRAVALRATLPRVAALPTTAERERAVDALYWRGTVYDTYDRGHWTRSRRPELRTTLVPAHGRVFVEDGYGGAHPTAPLTTAARQEIDVVGLSVPVAFALDRPFAFELASAHAPGGVLQLAPRWSGEVALRLAPQGAAPVSDGADDGRTELRVPPSVRYVAYSDEGGAGRTDTDAAPTAEVMASYLELPAELGPRVGELARRLAVGATSPAAIVGAVTDWLRASHEYTLNLPRPTPGVDPVESFLFDARAGHCEYFATAAALLLRAAGVPSRYVNGYLGGEWNDIGHYVAVRDNRAHSWVEAFLPGTGWTRIDATPPLPTTARAGRLRQLFDSLDYRWARAIVGYDLASQLGLAKRVAAQVGLHAPDAPGRRLPGWAIVLAAVAAVGAAAFRVWPARAGAPRAPKRAPPPASPAQHVYDRALARLARAGLPRRSTETPREYAARVAEAGHDAGAALVELTELYTASRFGRRDVDRATLHRLARRVAALPAA